MSNNALSNIALLTRRPIVAIAWLAALLSSGGCSSPEQDITIFKDVSTASGLDSYRGMTHGAAWGDFDGDGLPDLYLTNHLNEAALFRNLGEGRFTDVSSQWFTKDNLGGDKHGAAWADADNDGRLDLVQLTGAVKGVGSEPKRLFMNLGTRFEDVAETAGVSNLFGRTRMPLWLDLDGDGQLDLFHGAEERFDEKNPPFFFLQRANGYIEDHNAVQFASRSVPFCIAGELNGQTTPELLCRVAGKSTTSQVFDISRLPARDLNLLPVTAFEDAIAGDFDNDGRVDVFLARKNPSGPVAIGTAGDNALIADVTLSRSDKEKARGFSFRTTGSVSFNIVAISRPDTLGVPKIHIGETGRQAEGMQFTLSPKSTDTAGIMKNPEATPGIHVGRIDADRWQLTLASPFQAADANGTAKSQQITLRITATSPITEVKAADGAIHAEEAPQRLFMNRDGKLIDESDKRGMNQRPISAMNAVAGDFDNDMDLDIFIVGSGDVGTVQNMLLLNRGDGHFDVVKLAGGATGPTAGVGDSVTTADFDGDGFLDLLVATGGSMGRSLGLPSDDGAYQLYRNIGNENHWLEIDLQGTRSNRDGIGALVQLKAGGVTQTRFQDGGIHHRGQNHNRLHFGLAANTVIDSIEIAWPGGIVQKLTGTAANQTIRIIEPDH